MAYYINYCIFRYGHYIFLIRLVLLKSMITNFHTVLTTPVSYQTNTNKFIATQKEIKCLFIIIHNYLTFYTDEL